MHLVLTAPKLTFRRGIDILVATRTETMNGALQNPGEGAGRSMLLAPWNYSCEGEQDPGNQ